MKTTNIIRRSSSLFAATLLLIQAGHAQQQNFNISRTFATPNFATSQFGASATVGISDSYLVPTATRRGQHSVTANGSVNGRALGVGFRAAEGTATASVRDNGSGVFNGSLRLAGFNVMSITNANITTYKSPKLVKSFKVEKTIPLVIPGVPIPLNLNTKVSSGIEACFRADLVLTPTVFGFPQTTLSVGPEVSVGATAEASLGVGIPGIASASVGASGTLRIVTVGLKGQCTVIPVQRVVTSNGISIARRGADLRTGIVFETAGPSGKLEIFAQAEVIFVGTRRAAHTLASFSSTRQTTNLMAPTTFRLF